MNKIDVLKSLQKEFDSEAKPYFDRMWKAVMPSMRSEVSRKKQIVRKEFEFISSSNVKFYCLFIAKSIKIDPSHYFIVEFDWNNRHCYATFFKNESITVLQSHCIDRYKERVLKKDISNKDLFYKHLLRAQSSAFEVVLPTPTHKYSKYFGLADALFLGDFDPEILDCQVRGSWYNTCISLKEAGQTQSKLLKTLQYLQSFVKQLGYNPIETDGLNTIHKKQFSLNILFKTQVIEFYKKSYMLLQLHRRFNFWFTEKEINDVEKIENFLIKELESYGVKTILLSPYCVIDGIAIEGEIDYKGEK